MNDPTLVVVPARAARRASSASELHILIRLCPPTIEAPPSRPSLNLGLVIDRSGSMGDGRKMPYAIRAAQFAVEQLLPTDRVSVTTFDDRIETIVPNQPAANKSGIVAQIGQVHPRGSTALHGGWAEGVAQVEKGKLRDGLNRVLLLSDGLANCGLTAPDQIATEVHRARGRGVSTTTLGVGDDYNEDLMQAMATSGDGNYYFIDDPKNLPELFGAELSGLLATVGTNVTLRLEPQNGATVEKILNDLPHVDDQSVRLSNLILGMPIEVVVKLKAPAGPGVAELLRVRAEWDSTGEAARKSVAKSVILPSVPDDEWDASTENSEVRERVALLEAARLKQEVAHAMACGDVVGTRARLSGAREFLAASPVGSEALAEEYAQLQFLEEDLAAGALTRGTKRAKWFSHNRNQSRPDPGTPPKKP